MRSRSVWVVMVVFLLVCFISQYGAAQEKPKDYPKRQVEFLVGAGPGGGTDIFARTISIEARRLLGVPLVVLNLPAAAGAEAVAELQKRPSDAHTLMAINPVQIITHVTKTSPFGPDAFEPIINCQRDVLTLLVRAESPFKTLDSLLDYARQNPSKLTVGGTGAGSFDEVMSALFAKAAGIRTKYIPFDSGSEMIAQLLGGHIAAILDEPGPVAPLLESGKVRMLLAFAEKRLNPFPEVPSSVERGWDVTLGAWRGIAAKKGTSPEIVAYLHNVFKRSMAAPAYKAVEKASHLELLPGYMTPEQFKQLMNKELEIYTNALKELGYVK